MIKKALLAAAAAVSAVALVTGGVAPAMAADDLIVNGGFNHASFQDNDGNWFAGSKMGGWDVNANSTGGNNSTVRVWYPTMDEQTATLAAPFTDGPWIRIMGSISQSIPTEAGKTYTLNYDSRATGSGPNGGGWGGGNKSYASVDGVVVDTFRAVANPVSTTRSVSFTATSNSTLLAFGNSDGGAVGFDQIQVYEVAENDSPIMIPAIAGGAGIAALAAGSAFIARRKNSRTEN